MKMLRYLLATIASCCVTAKALGGGGPWARIGPWNIFDDKDIKGEAGTLACAASPAANPDLIYAGGQNNGVSSGIIKTTDGGKHWTRQSKGLWDTRVLGVWLHPHDTKGGHVFAGTHSGVYESTDFAASWQLVKETANWGNVMSFRRGVIQGKEYILANSGGGILTRPMEGGLWQRIPSPGGIASNAHLSVVTQGDRTEVLTCIGGWGGGKLYYASLDTPAKATWTGPIVTAGQTYPKWDVFPGTSAIWGRCTAPTKCNPDVHPVGVFDNLASCQNAVKAIKSYKVYSYTYQHNVSSVGAYAGHCYAISSTTVLPPFQNQGNVDSGRAPGKFPGTPIDCANAAVDPNDRNHFLFSKGGEYRAWESKDAGKTVMQFVNHTHGVYFVMIDGKGFYYTATQAGAFVSEDKGVTWIPYHVIMHARDGRIIDRVPHDYQRIIPDFRTNGIAFPSDQGLHIVDDANATNYQLISAIGDMRNTMALSALISPNHKTGSRFIVTNLWDWDVAFSRDDGATWSGWEPSEKSPGSCGEGGGGQGMGASGKLIMFHHTHWYSSLDGGVNFIRGNLPGGGGAFDYVREAGSRSEPAGTCYALMDAPDSGRVEVDEAAPDTDTDTYSPELTHPGRKPDAGPHHGPEHVGYTHNPGLQLAPMGNVKWLMLSEDFGQNWTWTKMPANLQAGNIAQDPTNAHGLFAITGNCIAHSTNKGKSWSDCSKAKGLTGRFSKLVVKDSKTMFMLRNGAVPLRTTDGGASWEELTGAAPLYAHGATFDASLSWSGKTLVLHGGDLGAIGRQEYGTAVWKSTDDGNTWTDETGDLVTISPGPGMWYEEDFYFVTRGEGVTVKRYFD